MTAVFVEQPLVLPGSANYHMQTHYGQQTFPCCTVCLVYYNKTLIEPFLVKESLVACNLVDTKAEV